MDYSNAILHCSRTQKMKESFHIPFNKGGITLILKQGKEISKENQRATFACEY